MKLKLFKRHTIEKPVREEIVVRVPDIKEHLVKEYERSQELVLKNEGLLQQIEELNVIKTKYEAALVTLDEYSKRLDMCKANENRLHNKIEIEKAHVERVRSELNSYKIKFSDAAITKEEIAGEIVEETKARIIERLNNHKGNLSKAAAREIIESVR